MFQLHQTLLTLLVLATFASPACAGVVLPEMPCEVDQLVADEAGLADSLRPVSGPMATASANVETHVAPTEDSGQFDPENSINRFGSLPSQSSGASPAGGSGGISIAFGLSSGTLQLTDAASMTWLLGELTLALPDAPKGGLIKPPQIVIDDLSKDTT